MSGQSESGGPRLLTGPGSLYAYWLQEQQRLQAYQQQVYAAQVIEAQQTQASRERRQATARQRRADELYRREARRRDYVTRIGADKSSSSTIGSFAARP